MDASIIDTRTGVEIDNVSECYLALAQHHTDTLPSSVGLQIEWGPCEARSRRALDAAPAWVWEAACEGRLCLAGGVVAAYDEPSAAALRALPLRLRSLRAPRG
jgi:hypothetical protein